MRPVAIVGHGGLGALVAARERAAGRSVLGLARRPREMANGDVFISCDLDEATAWPASLTRCCEIYYFVPPPETGLTDPRLERFLAACPPGGGYRLVLVSTTAVYGDAGGAWLDEQAPARPDSDRGRRRLAAEQALWRWRRQAPGREAVVLRVAGIYGPRRLPLERLRQGMVVLDESLAGFSNRIHEADLATACVAAMRRGGDGEVYNVSDGNPSSMTDYFRRVAAHFGLPEPQMLDWDEARQRLSPGLLSYLRESRRIDNRKLREQLGVQLRYPSLDEGLAACAAALEDG